MRRGLAMQMSRICNPVEHCLLFVRTKNSIEYELSLSIALEGNRIAPEGNQREARGVIIVCNNTRLDSGDWPMHEALLA